MGTVKVIKIFIILHFISMISYADTIRWFGRYERGREEAILKNRQILLLLLKNREEMKILSLIQNNSSISKCINEKYIAIVIIAETQNSYPIELYYTTIFPIIS